MNSGNTIAYQCLTYTGSGLANGGSATVAGNTVTRLMADFICPSLEYGGANVLQILFYVRNTAYDVVDVRPKVRMYAPDGPSGGPGTLLAAYTASPLHLTGYNDLGDAVVPAPGTLRLPYGWFWLGLCFDNANGSLGTTPAHLDQAGPILCFPPNIGSNASKYFTSTAPGTFLTNSPPGTIQSFQGARGFGWEIYIDTSVPTKRTTWGRLKALGAMPY
jgi:hypothetical protein